MLTSPLLIARSSRFFLLFCALTLTLVACGGSGRSADPRAALVASGELPVNYLHIYDNNGLMSFGTQVLSGSGSFEPVGPTIVLVVRNIAQAEIDEMAADGVQVEAHTAYLLTEGDKVPTQEALQRMSRIGVVDPGMTPDEIKARFHLCDAR